MRFNYGKMINQALRNDAHKKRSDREKQVSPPEPSSFESWILHRNRHCEAHEQTFNESNGVRSGNLINQKWHPVHSLNNKQIATSPWDLITGRWLIRLFAMTHIKSVPTMRNEHLHLNPPHLKVESSTAIASARRMNKPPTKAIGCAAAISSFRSRIPVHSLNNKQIATSPWDLITEDD